MARPFYRWTPVGRFNALPALGTRGALILPENKNRVAWTLINRGAGSAYLADDRGELNADGNVFEVAPGDSISSLFFAPNNEVFAVGATADLRVAETIEEA